MSLSSGGFSPSDPFECFSMSVGRLAVPLGFPVRSGPLFFRIRSLFKIRPSVCTPTYSVELHDSLSPFSPSYFILWIFVFTTNSPGLLDPSSPFAFKRVRLNSYSPRDDHALYISPSRFCLFSL